MNCNDVRERLYELVDGSLPASDAHRIEAHLEHCDSCRAERDELGDLLERSAALSRTIQPRHDLWPGILDGMAGGRVVRPRFGGGAAPGAPRWGLLAAAALALVVLSSGLTAVLLHGGAPVEPGPRVQAGTVAWREFTAAEREYRQIGDELLRALQERRGSLSEETIRVVESNLALIDAAIRKTRAALERDPANAGLANTLTDVYRKRVDFLRAMNRL